MRPRRCLRRTEIRTPCLSDAVDPDLRKPRRYLTAAAAGQTHERRELVACPGDAGGAFAYFTDPDLERIQSND
jgi:hypothetical protein